MLSEKAKGKQRAVDPLDDDYAASGVPESEQDAPRDLLIRFTEGLPDLNVSVNKLDSVHDVKRRIREARPELSNRRLRLIHSGRLLTKDTLIYSWLEGPQKSGNIEEGDADTANDVLSTRPVTKWFHCSVGQIIPPNQSEEDDHLQATQIQPIRGFDRLSSVGFSERDIGNLRRQFHSISSSNYLDHNFTTDDNYDEQIRTLEDQWIDSVASVDSGSAIPSSFLNSSILKGLLTGFFFPILPFVLMFEEKEPVFWEDGTTIETSNVLYSPHVKAGLIIGFLANILFGMWRYLLDSS